MDCWRPPPIPPASPTTAAVAAATTTTTTTAAAAATVGIEKYHAKEPEKDRYDERGQTDGKNGGDGWL